MVSTFSQIMNQAHLNASINHFYWQKWSSKNIEKKKKLSENRDTTKEKRNQDIRHT